MSSSPGGSSTPTIAAAGSAQRCWTASRSGPTFSCPTCRRCGSVTRSTPATARLEARGLRFVRHFWHMQVEPAGPVDSGRPPAGIAIGAIRSPDDLPDVHRVLETAFADHWDHEPQPYERWVDEEASGPDYDPTLWLVARQAGAVVGALTALAMGSRGWVGFLGVVAPYRGRGVATALLRHSFALFAARGIGRVALAVDAHNETAAALYERAGMRVVKRWDLWEKTSDRGRSAAAPTPGPF
jgi:mycothiol synthase